VEHVTQHAINKVYHTPEEEWREAREILRKNEKRSCTHCGAKVPYSHADRLHVTQASPTILLEARIIYARERWLKPAYVCPFLRAH
jgi:hypothetical protein